VLKFSRSIFKTGKGSCNRFIEQYEVALTAEDKNESEFKSVSNGMQATLIEVAKGLLPYQQKVFDSLILNSPNLLAEEVFNKCRYGHDNLLGSLMKVDDIFYHKSHIEIELEGFRLAEDLNSNAVFKAMEQYESCKKRNFSEGICFDSAESYYKYFLTKTEIENRTKWKRGLEYKIEQGISKNSVFEEVEDCRNKASAEMKLRISELNKYEEEVCFVEAKNKKLSALKERLKLMEDGLEKAKILMSELENQAISKDSNTY